MTFEVSKKAFIKTSKAFNFIFLVKLKAPLWGIILAYESTLENSSFFIKVSTRGNFSKSGGNSEKIT